MHIKFDKVGKYYRTKHGQISALSDVTWDINPGSVYGIIGPNGSGKTTLIRLLLDILRPDSGSILIDGQLNGNRTQKFRQAVGYVPEERGVYKDNRPLALLRYLASLKGITSVIAEQRARRYITEMQLQDSIDKPLQSFSKGMSQKIQLIAAVLHEPTLLILDEPFSGLDPINVRLVREFIRARREAGGIVIISTHMMDEAERLCDQITMLKQGKVVCSGPQNELRKQHGALQISLQSECDLSKFQTVDRITVQGSMQRVYLKKDTSVGAFLQELGMLLPHVQRFEISPASLEEIYVNIVGASPDLHV